MLYSILLTDLISLSDCLYFLRYWAICVLQLFVFQVVTSQILKLTYLSNQAVFLSDHFSSILRGLETDSDLRVQL